MKSSTSRRILAASLTACFVSPQTVSAFGVTDAHRRSTYLAVTHWAAEVGYAVIWQPRTTAGTVLDFPAPSRDVHEDFWFAVEALVTGAAYGRANMYCIPPSEFRIEAIIDDRMRLVYVIGRPTLRRCVVPRPLPREPQERLIGDLNIRTIQVDMNKSTPNSRLQSSS
ncbi:hypothetical protein [Cupriavidus sp. SK-4]|uniref:hypothetical protein n=1 Tax=Cupriavidus sp. SK-4 TaxID=574750 RepID=UPI00190F3C50|nr:hypothetical protein [Cupriavidus sp. SK-4]